jgi:hypothetical protein
MKQYVTYTYKHGGPYFVSFEDEQRAVSFFAEMADKQTKSDDLIDVEIKPPGWEPSREELRGKK